MAESHRTQLLRDRAHQPAGGGRLRHPPGLPALRLLLRRVDRARRRGRPRGGGQIVRDDAPRSPRRQNLEELAFFDDRKPDPTAGDATEKPAAARDAAGAAADSTLAEDVTGDFEPDEAGAGGGPGHLPMTTRTHRGRAPRPPPRGAGGRRRAAEEPRPPSGGPRRRPDRPLAEAAAPAAPAAEGLGRDPGLRLARQGRGGAHPRPLASGGFKAFLSPVEKGGRTMYRVRIGPFSSRDDAEKVAEKVRKGYKLDTWVTE